VRLLTEHLQFARQTHNAYQEVGILALLAIAHQRQRQSSQALALLAESVSLAEPGGIIRPFVELDEEMARLLKALVESRRSNSPREFTQWILEAFSPQQDRRPSPSSSYLVEPLTGREMDILALLARRYSNQEIAEELVISVVTVKRHASNIYGKLQVKGRWAAVEKAYALGIL